MTKLAPGAADRAEETETTRRLLPDAERELREAGLLRLLQPRRRGGFELEHAGPAACRTWKLA